jgi:hypothetical protein
MNKKHILPMVLAVFFLLSISMASAQNMGDNILGPVFEALAKLRIFENYSAYPYVFDFIIFLIFFAGISRFILSERIGSVGATGLGIVLATGLGFFEFTTHTSLIQGMGPVAVLVSILAIGVLLYLLIARAGGNTGTAAAAAYAITFAMLVGTFPPLLTYLQKSTFGNLLFVIMVIVWFIAVIFTIMGITRAWGSDRQSEVAGAPNFWERVFRRPERIGPTNPPNTNLPQPTPQQTSQVDLDLDQFQGNIQAFRTYVNRLVLSVTAAATAIRSGSPATRERATAQNDLIVTRDTLRAVRTLYGNLVALSATTRFTPQQTARLNALLTVLSTVSTTTYYPAIQTAIRERVI